jgi:hypothetical protein
MKTEVEVETELAEEGEEEASICDEEDFTCMSLNMDSFYNPLHDSNPVVFYEGSNTVPNCA